MCASVCAAVHGGVLLFVECVCECECVCAVRRGGAGALISLCLVGAQGDNNVPMEEGMAPGIGEQLVTDPHGTKRQGRKCPA